MVKSPVAAHKKREKNTKRSAGKIGALYSDNIHDQTLARAADNVKQPRHQKKANARNQEGVAVQHRIEEIRDNNSGKAAERRIRILHQRLINLPPRQSSRASAIW